MRRITEQERICTNYRVIVHEDEMAQATWWKWVLYDPKGFPIVTSGLLFGSREDAIKNAKKVTSETIRLRSGIKIYKWVEDKLIEVDVCGYKMRGNIHCPQCDKLNPDNKADLTICEGILTCLN